MSAADAIREIQELANALAAAEEQLADLRTRVERADKELARAEGTLDEVIEDALRFRALPQLDDATVEAYAQIAREAHTEYQWRDVVRAVLSTFMARATSEEAMDDVTAPAIVRAALAYACTDLPVVDATEPLRFPGFKDAPADAELAEVEPFKLPHVSLAHYSNANFLAIEAEINRMRGDIARLGGGQ